MNAQTAGLLTAAISVVIAGIYSVLTFFILRANKRAVELMAMQHEAATRPYIVVDVFTYVGSPLFKLRIRNVGNSPAENLRISIDKDFQRLNQKESEYNLRNTYAFQNAIPSFVEQN